MIQSTTLYDKVLQCTAPVLRSTTPLILQYHSVLPSTTKSSTTLYYKELLQYHSVPVLLCTTRYYNVLFQYYSVLQSTTTYYSSTTLHYKVLLQYYSVLQSTTLALLCTTKYFSCASLCYKVLLQYYPVPLRCKVLLRTTKHSSSIILYYKVAHVSLTHETSFTMRGATKVILQLHQILRLPRKMNLIIDLRHI